MTKLRNVLVHLYMEVDLERLDGYRQKNLGDFDRFTALIGEYFDQQRTESYVSK